MGRSRNAFMPTSAAAILPSTLLSRTPVLSRRSTIVPGRSILSTLVPARTRMKITTSEASAVITAVVPIAATRSRREPPHNAYPMLNASIPATSATAALRVPLRNTIVRLSATATTQNARHRCSGGIEDSPPLCWALRLRRRSTARPRVSEADLSRNDSARNAAAMKKFTSMYPPT